MSTTNHNPDVIARSGKLASIIQFLHEDSLANGGTPPATGKQFTDGLDLIGEWLTSQKSTKERVLRALDLGEVLVMDYPRFHAELVEAYESDSALGLLAARLLYDGIVTDATTFGDLPGILNEDRANA